MTEVERIADQLKRAFEGNAWHGPAVQEVLAGVTPAQAGLRLGRAHTIWEITLHIAAWEAIVRRRLAGEVVPDVPLEVDWPPVRETTEAAWREALEELERGHRRLGDAVAGLSAARLAEKMPGQEQTVGFELDGIIQHDLYHAGQIAVLKKALT